VIEQGTTAESGKIKKLTSDFSKVTFCDRPRIVILEDDQGLANNLRIYLEKKLRAQIEVFSSSTKFIDEFLSINEHAPFCFLTDISLGNEHDGLFILDLLKKRNLPYFCIVMTGFASIESAISATKKGVHHYLTKPFELEQLCKLIIDGYAKQFKMVITNSELDLINNDQLALPRQNKIDHRGVKDSVELPELQEGDFFNGVITKSAEFKEILNDLEKISTSNTTVLLQGESGTGKKFIAKKIHELSTYRERGLYNINCRSIPADLLESELFGHVEGAFNGAISDRKGRFELADNSSLVLEEISALPVFLQIRILKLLQTKQVEPLGGHLGKKADFRLIVCSNKNLEQEVLNGNFREDLFYRLNIISLSVPPLRKRICDIPYLISLFLKKFVSADKSNLIKFSESALKTLMNYDWPGNISELESIIERLVILKGGKVIYPEDLPSRLFRENPLSTNYYKSLFLLPEEGINIKQVLNDIEESLLHQAIQKTGGNKNKASKLLGLNRTTLIEKLKKRKITQYN
jgi:DNA-binding NtrC family response regulator